MRLSVRLTSKTSAVYQLTLSATPVVLVVEGKTNLWQARQGRQKRVMASAPAAVAVTLVRVRRVSSSRQFSGRAVVSERAMADRAGKPLAVLVAPVRKTVRLADRAGRRAPDGNAVFSCGGGVVLAAMRDLVELSAPPRAKLVWNAGVMAVDVVSGRTPALVCAVPREHPVGRSAHVAGRRAAAVASKQTV